MNSLSGRVDGISIDSCTVLYLRNDASFTRTLIKLVPSYKTALSIRRSSRFRAFALSLHRVAGVRTATKHSYTVRNTFSITPSYPLQNRKSKAHFQNTVSEVRE